MNVYVIESEGGMCKIGKANDPARRLQSLSTGHPYKLSVAHVFGMPSEAEAYRVEQTAHVKLASFRMTGEWFRIDPIMACNAIEEAITPPPSRTVSIWAVPPIAKVLSEIMIVQLSLVAALNGETMTEDSAREIADRLRSAAGQIQDALADDI